MKQKIREFLNNGGLLCFFIALGIWHAFSPNSKYIEAIVYLGMLLALYAIIKKNIRTLKRK